MPRPNCPTISRRSGERFDKACAANGFTANSGKGALWRKHWKSATCCAPAARASALPSGKSPFRRFLPRTGCILWRLTSTSRGSREAWATTGQLGDSLKAIHWPKVLSEADFGARVTYEIIDMRDLSALPREAFDFGWSSCSFEHLGTLEAGLRFWSTHWNR